MESPIVFRHNEISDISKYTRCKSLSQKKLSAMARRQPAVTRPIARRKLASQVEPSGVPADAEICRADHARADRLRGVRYGPTGRARFRGNAGLAACLGQGAEPRRIRGDRRGLPGWGDAARRGDARCLPYRSWLEACRMSQGAWRRSKC